MSSSYGKFYHFTIFGESHGPAIGVTVEGLPAGSPIDRDGLAALLSRRAPGQSSLTTARKEPDEVEFISGLVGDTACGTPLTAIIRNRDVRPGDYEETKALPRPGHADLTAEVKYRGFQAKSGGGHFSGRLTAALCVAGGIALQQLSREGISVEAKIVEIGGETEDFEAVIAKARDAGDSVGGIIECTVTGLPAGLGDPIFDGLENRLASILFGIPAVKGVEFGGGFALARLRGSEANDAYTASEGQILTETNHCGGILGGISDGMPLVMRAAFKPTPSIRLPQQSVSLATGKSQELITSGRHDPCIVLRAVPVVEAAAAAALYDAFLERKTQL